MENRWQHVLSAATFGAMVFWLVMLFWAIVGLRHKVSVLELKTQLIDMKVRLLQLEAAERETENVLRLGV